MLWCALAALAVMGAEADPLPQDDWNNVQIHLLDGQSKPGKVPRGQNIADFLNKLDFKAGSTFKATMYRTYGTECSERVLLAMQNSIGCLKRQLDVGQIAALGTGDFQQALLDGNLGSLMCGLADMDGAAKCVEQLQASLTCTHDNRIFNWARTITAYAREYRHLCRDGGALLDRGLRQLQTCAVKPWSRIAECGQHFQQLMDEQQIAGTQPALLADPLAAMEMTYCPGLVSLARCVPPALGHCSPVMKDIATDAFREVVFRGICADSAAIEAVDEFGGLNYYYYYYYYGAAAAAVLTLMLLMVALLFCRDSSGRKQEGGGRGSMK